MTLYHAINCNLCKKSYRSRNRFERFCKSCRFERYELLRFADCMN
jgi:hypothetical protein